MTTPLVTPSDADVGALDIPLPETRRTSRVRRRQEVRRRRRRRMGRNGGMALVVLLAAVLVVRALAGPPGDGDATAERAGSARTAPPALLLVQRGDAGRAVSLFVLAPAVGGKGGTLLLMPPGAMAEAPSLGLQPLGHLLELGGPDGLVSAVRNLLGAAIADVHVVDGAGLAALVAPAGPLSVNVPERVEKVDARGTVEIVYEAGPTRVEPGEVPRLLAEKGRGTDLTRLARHQAFWDAWLARLGKQAGAVPAEPPALERALAALAAGEVRTRVLPVNSLGVDADTELYQVEREQVARLAATMFPSAPRAAGERPRIQILNGTGAPGLGQRVAEKLGAGFDIRLTGNAARFDYAETQVVFYDRKQQPAAERVRAALGMGKLVLSRNPLDVVDVTIIVGKDFS
ncbi:MAG TPA: LytR C-terminal domain-containing protein [Acidimicrobiales bacterium]|nr:LytR C-terminal domain-containing protein [Acidimicrobiales bacterium]